MLFAEPARGGHGALDIKAIGLLDIEDGTKAEFEHQQRMLHQEAAQAGTEGQAFFELEQQSLDVSRWRVRPLARLRGIDDWLRHDRPVKEGKEAAIALHDGIMVKHTVDGLLVEDL